jgi:membrane-bound lytic murein transglycosylase A
MASRRTKRPAIAILSALVVLLGAVALLWWYERGAPAGPLSLEQVSFQDLPGWQSSDSRPALAAFGRSCEQLLKKPALQPMSGSYGGTIRDWRHACMSVPTVSSADAARIWFEENFVPLAVGAGLRHEALFTGYYEPELRGAHSRHGVYQTPVYGMPADLVEVELGIFRDTLKGERIAGRLEEHRLVPFATRAEIDRFGLRSAPILFYASDPVAVFFLHIQGSGRVRFEDGEVRRVAYAGQNGWPYTPVGRVLIEQGALEKSSMSLQAIKAWMKVHPAEARRAMEQDQSFVFFKDAPLGDPALGSPGSEGAALTPGASMAIDARIHALGAPFYIVASVPNRDPAKPEDVLASLFIAQDIGGAIRGPLRGDLFYGYGAAAESMAGRTKATGKMYVLVPKSIAAREAGA